MPFGCGPGQRDCYVNANFMIDLRARKKAAWRRRRAREFARRHRGRLFTYERFAAREVPDRVALSNMHDILLVADCGDETRENAVFRLAANLIEEIGREHEITDRTARDLEHVAAAIVLGARYYVTSDETLCRWINNGYPHLFRGLRCINHRRGESCDLAREESHAREDRRTRSNTLVRQGSTSRGQRPGRKGKSSLRKRPNTETGSRSKAKKPGHKRKREIARPGPKPERRGKGG